MKKNNPSEAVGVIDIGSNTVLLTAGRLDPQNKLEVLLECHGVARLAEHLQDDQTLHPQAKARVLEHLKSFQAQAVKHGIEKLYAAGTAAFRRASDGTEFAKEIEKKLGIPTRILSGNEEAHYSYLSAVKDLGFDRIGMIDIGGGSTEFVFGDPKNWVSLPLGTVRLFEKCQPQDPISDEQWQRILAEIDKQLAAGIPSKRPKDLPWLAVAATPTTLASVLLQLPEYDPKRVHGYRLKKKELTQLLEKIRQIPLSARKKIPGMLPDRAELLPIGGAILWRAMEYLGLEELQVSHHGLRYGILWEMLESYLKTKV